MRLPGSQREPFVPPQSRLRRLSGLPPHRLLQSWAEQEAAHAQLGDARLTKRLVLHLTHAAGHPAGTLAAIYRDDPAGLDAAYKFHENERVSADAIAQAHGQASAKRSEGFDFVFVAVDGSSLTYDDPDGSKGLGSIGSRKQKARGLKFMTALSITPQGVPLGLLAQSWWLRPLTPPPRSHQARSVDDKETRYWLEVMAEAQRQLTDVTRPWFQLDREGDSWPVLLRALEQQDSCWVTVRARSDRALIKDATEQDDTEPGGKLWAALVSQPVEATYELDVSAGAKRQARRATMTLRWREVTLRLRNAWTKTIYPATVWSLLACEQGTTPAGEKPLQWMLHTTRPIESLRDACQVLFGYTCRWRIEEFHAALKSRGCAVEDSEMASAANLQRFAVTSSIVAMRLVRLSYLARHQPELPATVELTEFEEKTLRLMSRRADPTKPQTIRQAVERLGDQGGHVGSYETRPVGFKVLARGWEELATAVRVRELVRSQGRDEEWLN